MVKEEVESRAEKVQEELGSDVDAAKGAEHNESSWAEAVKSGRKIQKNLIVVKASTQERKATNIEDEVSKTLNSI